MLRIFGTFCNVKCQVSHILLLIIIESDILLLIILAGKMRPRCAAGALRASVLSDTEVGGNTKRPLLCRSRAWCFTINNWEESDADRLRALECGFIVFGREKGEQGTSHLQGYVYFRSAITFRSAKRKIGETAHIEKARGTAQENDDYCTKDGDFERRGDLPSQGKRNDLHVVTDRIAEGASMNDIANEFPVQYVHFNKGLRALKTALSSNERYGPPLVIWIVGPSGIGKSRMAHQVAKEAYYKNSSKWWDGYEEQREVVFDDFRIDQFRFDEVLKMIDRYPLQVEIKGGSVWLRANRFIFTSINHPHTIDVPGEDMEQLRRRIHHVIEVENFENGLDDLEQLWYEDCDLNSS